MVVHLTPITSDNFAVLERLFSFYVYEFSQITQLGPDNQGDYPYNPQLIAPYRQPTQDQLGYFIVCADKLAGFALIQKAQQHYDVEQFFVVKKFTRQGVGQRAFSQIVTLHPGHWQIRVLLQNTGAQKFWRSAIQANVDTRYIHNQELERGQTMDFFRFTTSA